MTGAYYYNTTDNKLYKELNGLWTASFNPEKFIRADGNVYISANNADAQTYVGTLGSFVKASSSLYKIYTIGIPGLATTGLGAQILQVDPLSWYYDSTYNKLYYGCTEIKIAINISVNLSISDEYLIAPPNPIIGSGVFYYNTNDNKLYKENNGVWTCNFLSTCFTRADGRIYISANNSEVQLYLGVLNSLVQLIDGTVSLIIANGIAKLGVTVIPKYKSANFLINVNEYSDKLYTITINTPIGTSTKQNDLIELSNRTIKVCPNNIVYAGSPIIWLI